MVSNVAQGPVAPFSAGCTGTMGNAEYQSAGEEVALEPVPTTA